MPKKMLLVLLSQCLGIFWLSCVAAIETKEIKFMTQEFAPFSYSSNDEVSGPVAEIIRTVCQYINVRCSCKSAIWPEAQEEVKRGRAQGLFVVGWNKKREQWLYFSPPILTTEYGFFVREDAPLQFKQASDVKGYTVAVYGPSNTSFALNQIKDTIGDLRIDISRKDEFAFNKLSLGRVDAVYSNREVGFDLIQKLKIKNIRYAGKHQNLYYHIGFSKEFASLNFVQKFNSALHDLYFKNVIQDILTRFNMSPVEPKCFNAKKWNPIIPAQPLNIMALDFPPYEFKQNGRIDGITVRIVKEVFKRLNQPIVIEMLPWPRALFYLKTGKGDAAFEILKKPEREAYVDYSQEILMDETASLFVAEDSKIVFDGHFEKLSSYTFGARQAFSYGPLFDTAANSGVLPYITKLPDAERLILLLCNHRIDILIGDQYGVPYLYNRLKHNQKKRLSLNIKRLSPDVQSTPAYMAFSKKRHLNKMRKRFDSMLAEIKKNGTYAQIINTWETGQPYFKTNEKLK